MKASYINDQLLNENLTIRPNELNSNLDLTIKDRLKEQVEGVCFKDGFIIPGSVRIIKRKLGKVITTDNKSGIVYNIEYTAKVISPTEGDFIDIIINNVNKMGAIGYIKLNDDGGGMDDSPLIIMIPSEYFEETIYNIDDVNTGQKMTIQVIGSRLKFNSDKIQIIGKPV